jgi:WD40 repeat protein
MAAVSTTPGQAPTMTRTASKKKEKEKQLSSGDVAAMSPMPMDELKRQFDWIDSDGNGTLELSELKHACTQLGVKCTDNSAKKVFKMLDEDGSGAIDWQEFLKFFCKVSDPEEMKGLLAAHNQRFFDYKLRVKTDPNILNEYVVPRPVKVAQNFRSHTNDVVALAWLTQDKLISCGLDGTVAEWDVQDRSAVPQPWRQVTLQDTGIYCMDTTQGGRGLLLGIGKKSDNLGFCSIDELSIIQWFAGHEKPVFSCAITANEKYAASGDQAGSLMVHDVERGALVSNWAAHDNAIADCNFNRDWKRICTASRDGQVKIFDIGVSEDAIATIEDAAASERVNSALWCKEHEILAAGDDFCIKRWDMRKPTAPPVASYLGHTSRVLSLTLSPDGQWLVSGASDGSVRVWEVEGETRQAALLLPQVTELTSDIDRLEKLHSKMEEEVWQGEGDVRSLQALADELATKKTEADTLVEKMEKLSSLDTVMARLDVNDHKAGVLALAWCDRGRSQAQLVSAGSDQCIQLANIDLEPFL